MQKTALIVANFGGPRDLNEVSSFLEALLTDPDVIRTPFPQWLQNLFFRRVAKKRAVQIAEDYMKIGGKSPIFEDTEWIASRLQELLSIQALSFHRYLRATHADFLDRLLLTQAEKIVVFPLFPQFTYATTGSIARWFAEHLPSAVVAKMQWIRSYPDHPRFVLAFQRCIRDFMQEQGLLESETAFLFSAHGLPESFILQGDCYQRECERSYRSIVQGFPLAVSVLGYQSQFGRARWIGPSTTSLSSQPAQWTQGRKQVVIIPLSFTSDHIETLFEIEEQYLPLVRQAGLSAFRCPALGRREDWTVAMSDIICGTPLVDTMDCIRLHKKTEKAGS